MYIIFRRDMKNYIKLKKNEFDTNEYHYFTTDDGLRVYYVENESEIGSVAMQIDVGSIHEYELGLAHFLEHMLFLGTEEYKDVNFMNYIAKNGGMTNAYTSDEHTCYYYTIIQEKLLESIKYFSRFFIDPILDETMIMKEINAVDAEHRKNVKSDMWRKNQAMKYGVRTEHAFKQFTTGNIKTLTQTNKHKKLHELTKLFFNCKYVLSKMTLYISGNEKINKISELVDNLFVEIKDKHEDNQYDNKLDISGKIFENKSVIFIPLGKSNSIDLIWDIPDYNGYECPTHFLGYILNNLSENSLSNDLINKKLITKLRYDIDGHVGDRKVTSIKFKIPSYDRIENIINYTFKYLKYIRENLDNIEYLYEELKTIFENDAQIYGGDSNHGIDLLLLMVEKNTVFRNIYDDVIRFPNPLANYDIIKKNLRELLDLMTEDNCLYFFCSQGFKKFKTNIDEYYGFEYNIYDGNIFIGKEKGVDFLPIKKNKFLSKYSRDSEIIVNDKNIIKLHEHVFYKFSEEYKPLTMIIVKFLIPTDKKRSKHENLIHQAGLIIYMNTMFSLLKPVLFEMTNAGYEISFQYDNETYEVELTVKGIMKNIMKVLDSILKYILNGFDSVKNIDDRVKENLIAININKFIDILGDSLLESAYIRTESEFSKVLYEQYFSDVEMYEALQNRNEKDELCNNINNLIKSDMRCIVVGYINPYTTQTQSICANDVISILDKYNLLNIKDIKHKNNDFNSFSKLQHDCKMNENSCSFFEYNNKKFKKIVKHEISTNDENSAMGYYVFIDKCLFTEHDRIINMKAYMLLLDKIISREYFETLRTHENFGYIAKSMTVENTTNYESIVYYKFLLQSPNKSSDEMTLRTIKFMYDDFKNILSSLSEKQLDEYKLTCVNILRESIKNIESFATYHFLLCCNGFFDIDLREQISSMITTINLEKLKDFYKNKFLTNKDTNHTIVISINKN